MTVVPRPVPAPRAAARAAAPALLWLALALGSGCGGEEAAAPEPPAPAGQPARPAAPGGGEAGTPAAAEAALPAPLPVPEPADPRAARIDDLVAEGTPTLVSWRRHLHQNPELSNREVATAELVADTLRNLRLEVRTDVAHTGVVGVLRGGRPGPVVAFRADMDALPVTEQTGLPFASTKRTVYDGREVGVMHACGHDAHVAILLSTAHVLARMREEVPGTVVFVFQPAEEGAPAGEEGGAELMLAEGVFADPHPAPEAIFGLHVTPDFEVGHIGYRSGAVMASSDRLDVRVRGSQTHAAYPWRGIDPVAAAARVVLAVREIPARRVDARVGSIVSIGVVDGGVRHNIIPEEVTLKGTIRSLDPEMRFTLHRKVEEVARAAAAVDGAEADVEIALGYPVTVNDPGLVERMLPTLRAVAGPERVQTGPARTGAEDFSFFAQEMPGFYFWLGVREPGVAPDEAAPNHSPRFTLDERALPLGVRAFANLAFDFLEGRAPE